MNRTASVLTSLTLTFVALLFLAQVKDTLNGVAEYKQRADFWRSKVAREQLKKLIVKGQFADFKQDIALLLPDQIKSRKAENEKQKLRDLASVIPQEKNMEINLSISAAKMLDKGKTFVKKREYKEGITILKALIDKFPDSLHLVEAHYLIVEAYAQQEKNLNVLTWVDKMVELYPSNRLTGYALLKAGNLYEIDGRPEDAIRIYKTIVAVYTDKSLLAKARGAVDQLEL